MGDYRFTCPEGHVNVNVRKDDARHGLEPGGTFYCDTCRKHDDRDGHYDFLIDQKTGEKVKNKERLNRSLA